MKLCTLLPIAAAVIVVICGILLIGAPILPGQSAVRGVRLLQTNERPEPQTFNPRQSAGLFIGVRKFTRDENTLEVPYAADDAVDLAYVFAFDRRVALVSPSRVVIALSGRPQKEESKRHLEELEQAGAKIEKAEASDILLLLQRQAALASKDGMLIVSIATHGFVRNGVPYILGSTSVFQFAETAVPVPRLFDIAATSDAPRSLFFVDACRERITDDSRAGASPETAAPLVSRMNHVHGQVVFYAAAAGGYAYDDDGNGVFTKAVLEGLRCKAAFARGAVTVETLHTFVERNVRRWIRQHRNATVAAATQVSMEGDSRNMPLCACIGPLPSPPRDVANAVKQGSKVTALAADGAPLWSRDVSGDISRVEVADIDDDGSHEVVIGAGKSLQVFDRTGAKSWSADEKMNLRAFVIEHLLRHDPTLQITTVWNDADQSVIATYNANGQCISRYAHHGRLQQVVIDRPTSHHNRKIVATGTDDDAGTTFGIRNPVAALVVLDNGGDLVWEGVVLPPTERVARLAVADRDEYSRDITLSTTAGDEIHVDFNGVVLAKSSPRVMLKVLPRNARRRTSS